MKRLLPDDGAWRQKAACRGLDPDLFFPARGENATHALQVCADCPVRADCLAYALDTREARGVWGGLTVTQRRRILRQRSRARDAVA